ncbi:MAG: DUF4493 domain-containing protein [Muribaculaceae bacterium]|nr:DUF4493 domain-containing protein [Muribaculaceae bacterium]
MKLKYQAALLTAALAMGSCSSDDLYGVAEGSMGKVCKPGVEVSNVEKVIKDAAGSRASYDISNYIVDFTRQGEQIPVSSYVYKDMPGAVDLPEGSYTVSVRSHNVQKAEWDNPYFAGESSAFTITAGEFTEVEPVKCTFQSLKVTVVFGPKLRAAMGDDVKVTVKANDEGTLVFTPAETRAGYFEAINGSVSMAFHFEGTVGGRFEQIANAFDNVEKGQHRIVTYELGAKPPVPDQPTGGISGDGISIDMEYVDEDLTGTVDPGKEDVIGGDEEEPGQKPVIPDPENPDQPDVPDQPENPDQPVVPSDNISFDGGEIKNGGSYTSTQFSVYAVKISAPKGCADINVVIDSTSLTPEELEGVGLSDKFSLVNDSQYFEALSGLSLPCGDAVKNQTEVTFDISSFMSLLGILGPSSSTFTLDVTDNEGNNEKMSFTIIVE